MENIMSVPADKTVGMCPICDREMIDGKFIDKHHLIPKSKNGKYTDTITLHRICHEKIHSIWTESELVSYYNTPARMKENADLCKFIKWVKKKPYDFFVKTKMSNARPR